MTSELEPAALEALAIETFERFRTDGTLATHGNRAYDLAIVPGAARAGEGGVAFTLRLTVYEDGQYRDIKEQEVWVVPGDADDARIVPYFEGIALGFQRFATDRADGVETHMPHDFIPARAFRELDCTSAEQFAAFVGAAEPDIADVLDDLSGTEPIARNEALERAIDEDPERVDAYLVYADWLAEQGDPRGELIACMAPNASPEAKRRGASVLAKHEHYFAGPFLSSERMSYYAQVDFKLGYFGNVRIEVDNELAQEIPDFAERALRNLLQLPSSRFLRGLTIGVIDFSGDCNFENLYPFLVEAGPRPSLTHLFIGDTTSEQLEISWTHAGDLAPLTPLYPNLRSLRVRAGSMELAGALAYPQLEQLALETGGLTAEAVREVAATAYPALSSLELWFGSSSYGATSTLDDIAPILAGERLPTVTRLALRNCEWTDALVGALAQAPILPRIRELDLSLGILTDAGVQTLLAHKRAFAHLAKLDVSENFLSEAAGASLADLGIEVTVGRQKQAYSADPEDRYVSVGE